MSFVVPQFPIVCDIYSGPWSTRVLRVAAASCNLAWGRRVDAKLNVSPFDNQGMSTMTLLLPSGTDVRDLRCGAVEDVLECPSGSGRWYQCVGVDDIGKGFPNEHRGAIIQAIFDGAGGTGTYPGLLWPAPIP